MTDKRGGSLTRFAGDQFCAISPARLAAMKKRPKKCSPVRWRIELSRRKMAEERPELLARLPDPDRL